MHSQDTTKRKLYISNIDYRTSTETLHHAFSMYGRIVEGAPSLMLVHFCIT